jgi:hypothetical protein
LVTEPPRSSLANVAPGWPVAARAQQAEQMRPKQGFSESRISLEENLQELQWQQRKASNYDSENRAGSRRCDEARDSVQ